MWDILTTGFFSVLSTVQGFVTTTTATIALLGAFAFWLYSTIDARVPRIVVAPVVGILVWGSAWVFATQSATEYERNQCDIRSAAAQKELNDKYLAASLQLRTLQSNYANERLEQEKQHSEERLSLLDLINKAEASEEEARKQLEAEQNNETPIAPESRPAIVYVPSSRCFSTSVPTNILQSINRAGRSNQTGR